jgi:hypothetical protein
MHVMGGRRGRLLRGAVLPLGAAVLLAGCASMPSSGEVRKVSDAQPDGDSQVRVLAVPPYVGESAAEIVDGFMDSMTSSELNFATAKKYLTNDAAAQWDPSAGITVLSGSLGSPKLEGNDKVGYQTVTLPGTKAAVVDTKHAYQPAQGPVHVQFHLVRDGKNEWRIDGLPDGLVMTASDFQRIYHSANMYYFARLGPDAGSDGHRRQTLVADPVYLRNEADPLVTTVSTLLGGPSDWLEPVVSSAAPKGARLYAKADDHGVTLDDSQHLRVRLDHSADHLGVSACTRLAAQLFATVQAQASAKLASADILRADGSTVCSLPSGQARSYGPDNLVGSTIGQYYISADGHGRLMELDGGSTTAKPVPGPFGTSKAALDSVAVRRDEQEAAGVRDNGRHLVVGPFVDGRQFSAPVLTSSAADPGHDGLSAPSWDGFGDLWVADRDPKAPALKVLVAGGSAAQTVPVPGLSGSVDALRVSSDGVRIALIVRQGGSRTLQIGLIERAGTRDAPTFEVTGLRSLTFPSQDVVSVSWVGSSKLVVLVGESGSLKQIEDMSIDGTVGTLQQSVSEAVSVAASEDPDRPLLASYSGVVLRKLPADSDWKQVKPNGTDPVYPG